MGETEPSIVPRVSVCATQTRTWREFSATYLPRLASCFFGLIAVRIWIQSCLYDRYTATDSGALTITTNLVRVVFIVILMIVAARQGFSDRQQKALSWFSVTTMTIAAILYLLQIELPDVPLSLAACICAGLGIVWGGGMWIRFFVRLEPGEALIYTFACLGTSSLLGLALGLLPLVVVYAIAIFMPTLSLVAYWQAMGTLDERRDFIPEPHLDTLYDAEPKHVIAQLLVGLALLEFALGVARGFPFGESIPLDVGMQCAHQAIVALLSLAIIWWVLIQGRGLRFGSLWRLQVALMVVGTVLIASLDDTAMPWGAVIITISNTLMLGVLWYCVYDFSLHSSIPSYVVLGAVWVVHMLPREAGRWAIFEFGPHTQGSVLAVAAMVCLLALSMAFVLRDSIPTLRPLFAEFASSTYGDRFIQRMNQLSGAEENERASSDSAEQAPATEAQLKAASEELLDHRCGALQSEYCLTDRETDMVRFIAQGRSKGYISNKLFISENTVKSYTRNVYHKLCIHSKQELLDVLYSEDDPFAE